MSLGLKDTESNIEAGLGTFVYTVTVAGIYNFVIQSAILPPSSLSIVINQNGSPIATSAAPSATQSHVELEASGINCSVNDSITFVLTSSAASDTSTKSLINIIQETLRM
jgi:hypothetical protein